MSSQSPWNETQKDDIVRCQAENSRLREEIHIASRDSNPVGGKDSLFDKPEALKLSQQRDEILTYATEKYGIQSFEELKNHAREITQQRELAHQFEQQLQQHYEPAEPQIPPDFQKPISHHEQPPTEVKTGKTVADRYREATERYHEREHRPTREYNFEQGKNPSLEE